MTIFSKNLWGAKHLWPTLATPMDEYSMLPRKIEVIFHAENQATIFSLATKDNCFLC